ncbi:hypothetical protein M5689_024622 [Euphorbia peplus]|nr:hypothetical protein M5689_024622 [Euphorbia peplus]
MIWITRKLRHYFQSYEVLVVSKVDPMKHLATAPTLVGKLARWALLLSEFDIKFVNSKVVKGKAVAEFLARQPLPEAEDEPWQFEFPDENLGVITIEGWRMHFDGAQNRNGSGAGVVLVSPTGLTIPLAKRLQFKATNNTSEYEACLFGIEALISLGCVKYKSLQIRC